MSKQYRKYTEEWLMDSNEYGVHVSAMTGEQLHSKSDIAAELAWRDSRIAELEKERDELIKNNDELEIEILQRMLAVSAMEDRLKNQAKRDLEMQAKGVECFVADYKGARMDFSQAERRIRDLRTQAKQLREGVNTNES